MTSTIVATPLTFHFSLKIRVVDLRTGWINVPEKLASELCLRAAVAMMRMMIMCQDRKAVLISTFNPEFFK